MSRLRRGHRLHSIGGFGELDLVRFGRTDSVICQGHEGNLENEFVDYIRFGDAQAIRHLIKDAATTVTLSQNWELVRICAKEVMSSSDNIDVLKAVLDVLTDTNPHAFKVGELFILEGMSTGNSTMVVATLQYWAVNKGIQGVFTSLDVIHTAVYYAATRKIKDSETLALVETAIYCATVDKQDQVLQDVLRWHDEHVDLVGASIKLNADCMIHAALEDDKDRLKALYAYGYRLGADTDRRINKDYLKRIKLFRARASPVYNIVAFEDSKDVQQHDPLKKSFEYARKARSLAVKIQDFTTEYTDIARKCEDFAKDLLDTCTTKHEVQTLLQTRSYLGHTDANFNIAILDGHKEFVAHEKFQQMLHKKWGQKDRLQWKDTPSYNIFWSEMNQVSKLIHIIKQIVIFFILPLVVLASTCSSKFESCFPCNCFIRQSQIPVNRFLYWEMSKLVFYGIVMCTLVDDEDVAWYDMITVFWIVSYLLENVRTIHRLYRYSTNDSKRILKRWLTFRNIYILSTDIVFLVAFILRCVAFFNDQCRKDCPYEGNEIAFIAAAVWSFAALLAFLRSIQGGLMWRQTGPIIISMSYMILDVMVFLFIFVIVYISFTLSMVSVYNVYGNERTEHFNTHRMAFKLFFWAMIRTGNPQYADIKVFNATAMYNSSCLQSVVGDGSLIASEKVSKCAQGSFGNEIEEGIPYIAGNTLWALYQFTVVIVLLSILRARMVNTYHRIFKEADVQWKYFRASIWWKYLDEDSILPPPFTLFYLAHQLLKKLYQLATNKCSAKMSDNKNVDLESPRQKLKREQQQMLETDKRQFEKRYTHLMLMLVNSSESKEKIS